MATMRLATSFLLMSALLTGCPKGGGGGSTGKIDTAQLEVDPKYNFEAGIRAMQPDRKGNTDLAAAYGFFRKAAVELNGGAKAHFNAGYVSEKLGDLDQAKEHYLAAWKADANYEPALFSLTRLLKGEGEAGKAAELYALHIESHPSDKAIRVEYMDTLVAAGDYATAIEQAQEVLRNDPDNAEIYRSLSGLYFQKGDLNMARILGEKALALNDADPDVYNNMGVVYLESDDIPEAIRKFQTARKLDAQHFEANMNLGYIALDSGDYALALECFKAAVERSPSDSDAKVGLAIAMRGTGDLDGAGRVYDDLIKIAPGSQLAYYNAATLHEKYTKDFTKALKYLEAFKVSQTGELSPSHDVFERIMAIERSKAEEEERKRAEAERKQAELQRQARNKELLDKMATVVTDTQARIDANASCLPPDTIDEMSMILEQAVMVVDEGDADMASDIQGLLESYAMPTLEAALAEHCAPGGAVEEDGGEAPPEGEEPAEDEAPAEGEDAEPAEEVAPIE